MKLLVLLDRGVDVRVPPLRDPRSGRVREEWLVRETDPGSAAALDLALRLKTMRPDTEVTLVHFGPPDAEPWLRRESARGADRVVRVWDEEAAGVQVAAKALILAAAAQAAGFDLVLAGAAGVVDACGQLGVLLAANLGVTCVTQVIDIVVPAAAGAAAAERPGAGEKVEITRVLDRGFRERAEAHLPLVATVAPGAAGGAPPADIPAAGLLAAQTREVAVWDLADLGVPRERVRRADGSLRYGRPQPRSPRLRPIAAPDPALPAFDRILKLIEGSVQRREGRVVRRPAEETVEEIFRTLRDESWLDHLRRGGGLMADDCSPDGEQRAAAGDLAASKGFEAGDCL